MITEAFIEKMRSEIPHELVRRGAPDELHGPAEALFNMALDQRMSYVSDWLRKELDKQLVPIAENIEVAIKRGHLAALSGDFDSMGRVERYLELEYRVVSAEQLPYILPDTYVCSRNGQRFSPILTEAGEVQEVLLPISSNLCVQGYRSAPVDRPSETTNRILASSSFEAFVARDNLPSYGGLMGRIGKNAIMLSSKTAREIIGDPAQHLVDEMSKLFADRYDHSQA